MLVAPEDVGLCSQRLARLTTHLQPYVDTVLRRGGAASTAFWMDPQEDLMVIFMTQLMPSSSYPLRRELRTLAYEALTA